MLPSSQLPALVSSNRAKSNVLSLRRALMAAFWCFLILTEGLAAAEPADTWKTEDVRQGDLIFFRSKGPFCSLLAGWIACEFSHVGIILENPKTERMEVFESTGEGVHFKSFADYSEEGKELRVCVRSYMGEDLDQEKLSTFIEQYEGERYRDKWSAKGCLLKRGDAAADDKAKIKKVNDEGVRVEKETPGIICSELVAHFLHHMGMLKNKFQRWKHYAPRHFLYGLSWEMEYDYWPLREENSTHGDRVLKRGQGFSAKQFKKLNALTSRSGYRLIDGIPGLVGKYRRLQSTFSGKLTEIYRKSGYKPL